MVDVTTTGLRATGAEAATLPDVAWAIAAGTADIITADYDDAVTALTDGLIVGFRASAANVTTTPTFSPDGLTARTIVKKGGVALAAGDIPGALAEMLARYNLANTRWELLNPAPAAASASATDYPLPFIAAQPEDNLHIKNDTTDATNDMQITVGKVRDDANTVNMQLFGTMRKQLDVAWASGGTTTIPAGGCDTSTKGNNQTWHAFLIGKLAQTPTLFARASNVTTLTFAAAHGLGAGATIRVTGIGVTGFDTTAVIASVTTTTLTYANTGADVSSTGVTGSPTVDCFDVLFSQTYSGPTMPSGWTVKQCLGSILSDGSAVTRPFLQIGDYFLLKTPPAVDINTTTSGTTAVLIAIKTPLGVRTRAKMNVRVISQTVAGGVHMSSPDTVDLNPSGTATPLATIGLNASGTPELSAQVELYTDTLAQVRYDAGNNATIYSVVLGWFDPRRRMF